MLFSLIKFVHILLVLSLLGSAIYCCIAVGLRKLATANSGSISSQPLRHLNKIMLLLSLFAMLTGTLLVKPNHFTFETPWIQAAYLFLLGIIFCLGLFVFFQNRIQSSTVWRWAYLVLVITLIFVIRDAVTKTTFLFG